MNLLLLFATQLDRENQLGDQFMSRTSIALSVTFLATVLVGSVQAQMGPPAPAPELKKLDFMAGDWSAEGTGSMGKVNELAVLGYDSDKKAYTYHAFDSVGEAANSTGTVDGDTWTWTADEHMGGMTMKGRYTMKVLSPTSYTMKYELSQDGSNWTTAMEGKATKK
ncbi:MAG: hypothetical protein DMG93_20840 [Acidobacteria bacterium]|nr:MAG: hypothetical protein DMG93_20840 [Acidobacteriota bacterium]